MTLFQGLSAFPITPADTQGRVDAPALRRLIRRLVAAEVDSIGLLGSTGTYAYLGRTERRRAIEVALDEAAGKTPVMVGIGALRTDEALLLGEDAQGAGAAGVLLAPVSYTPLTDDEVFTHFATVAEALAIKVCIYNNPGTTHFSFSPALIGRLSQLPTIVAVKNPAPEAGEVAAQLLDLRARVGEDFSLGYSVDIRAIDALLAGGQAWYSVIGGLFPEPCMQAMRAIRAGDAAEARRIHARLQPLWDLFNDFTSLRVVYAAANLLGLCHSEPPRPILPLGEAAQRRIARVLQELELG
jgi:4-hydroxy-tetrahydrodipicolinate synthase